MYIPEVTITKHDIVGPIGEYAALNVKRGTIMLVRSDYKHDTYADHASLILGGLIQKERGVRPNLLVLPNIFTNISKILDGYVPINNKVLVLLTEETSLQILKMLGLYLSAGELLTASNQSHDKQNS